MSSFEKQYGELLTDIMSNGVMNKGLEVRTVWKDGEPAYTKALWGRLLRFKPEDGFPILTRKFVNPKSFTSEMLWIMQKASNDVQVARDLGTKVWDEWENEDGDIGTAYGYQIANNTYKVMNKDISEQAKQAIGKDFYWNDKEKTSTDKGEEENKDFYRVYSGLEGYYVNLNQIDYVIHQLIDNPYSRQTVTTLMNPKENHTMELPPCVWASHWEVMGDGKLYLSVKARSSDVFLGLPFNVSQYALLHRLIAQITGWPIGDFVLTIDDAHLYDRHIPVAMEYLNRKEQDVPEMWINKNITNFQDFKYEKDFGWSGYTKEVYLPLKAPIAIGRGELERLRKKQEDK